MSNLPAKVVAVVGAEVGLLVGLSVILFHTLRVAATASKQETWRGFRSL